jgi:hypothetical protein
MKIRTKVMTWASTAIVAGAAGAVAWNEHEEQARVAVDTDAILCLMHDLTPQEKQELATLSNSSDYRPLLAAYNKVFPRCVFRADQWERKGKLTFNAWQLLHGNDAEFDRMEKAGAVKLSQPQ